jgi:hypothetical protein
MYLFLLTSITFVVWVTEQTSWDDAQKIEVNDFHMALRDLEPGKKYRARVTMRDRDGFHSTFSETVTLEPLPGKNYSFLFLPSSLNKSIKKITV